MAADSFDFEEHVRFFRPESEALAFGHREPQLAAQYGVSKTPIREALAQLKLEGPVRIVPHSKTSVFTLSAGGNRRAL